MKVVSFSIKVPTSCKGDYVKASKTIKYFSLGVLIGATGIVLSSKLNKKSVDDIVVDIQPKAMYPIGRGDLYV